MMPTQEQINLACDIAVAVLYGDAMQGARLLAAHDNSITPVINYYSNQQLWDQLREAEKDIDRLTIDQKIVPLHEFLTDVKQLNHL
jgi:hypothetical protein